MPLFDYCYPNQTIVLTRTGVVECECIDDHYYWPGDGRCYKLYTRGPCNRTDEVLEMVEVTMNELPALFNENGNDGIEMTVTTRRQLTCKKSFCGGEELAYSEKHGYCFKLGTFQIPNKQKITGGKIKLYKQIQKL